MVQFYQLEMKIHYTKHAFKKQEILKELGWGIRLKTVEETIKNPQVTGKTKQGQPTAIKFLDDKHILRVVYEVRSGIITVITFHIARKGRYGI